MMAANTTLKPGGHSCGIPWPQSTAPSGSHVLLVRSYVPLWSLVSLCPQPRPCHHSPVPSPATSPVPPARGIPVACWLHGALAWGWLEQGAEELGQGRAPRNHAATCLGTSGPSSPCTRAARGLSGPATQRGWGSSISAFVPGKPSSGMDADDASYLGAKAPMLSDVLSQALLPDLGCFLPVTVMPVKSLKTSVGLVPKASSTCVTHIKWYLTGFC